MNKVLVPLLLALVCILIITGCSGNNATTTAPATTSAPPTTSTATQSTTTAPQPTSSQTAPATTTTAPSPTTSAAEQPVYGGNMVIIAPSGPNVLGYYPNMVVGDEAADFPAVERLVDATYVNGKPEYTGVLAESYNVDPVAKTMTFHIRQGVKFSDGSDLNANVVAWNFNLDIEHGRLQQSQLITGVRILDPYTVQLSFSKYNNEADFNWGWVPMFSEAAWEKAGTTDAQRIAWGNDHVVGTGPFMLKEYVRGDHLTWVKNPNYWQQGKPYLDSITIKYVSEATTASMLMQAKQADMWNGGGIQDQLPLVSDGMALKYYWPVITEDIIPNTIDPNSKWQNKDLREALEYAIDKNAIAQALGKGYYYPLNTMAPKDSWGYDPNYQGRSYDPAKAKQLLAEAGYPNGLKVTLLLGNDTASVDEGTAVKQYLDAVGFQTNLDEADAGRYYGSMFGTGWNDLILSFAACAIHQDEDFMAWFGYAPRSNLASFKRDYPDLVALEHQLETETDQAARIKLTQQVYEYLENNALVTPLYAVPSSYVLQPWVHGVKYLQAGFIRWQTEDMWMAKH